MARGYRRKCKCCLKLFRPDPCNRRHQRYCAAPRCRRASKAASKSLARQTANQSYFRDRGTSLASAPGGNHQQCNLKYLTIYIHKKFYKYKILF